MHGTAVLARRRSAARPAIGACLFAAAAAALSGCAQPAQAAPPIQLGTAYVAKPGSTDVTDAYLVVQNNGQADRLLSASTSVGGRVTLRGPTPGSGRMRAVPDIRIPADRTIRLVPNGYHLVITGARPMHAGKEITLTLTFAHAGQLEVPATVTNPQTGGASYFTN
jgi:periplasmic copper chaperone A